jgi:hypothetical protein
MLATTRGKMLALESLKQRREKNATKVSNSSLPAGSPMYFDCLTCGETITVPEMYIFKSNLCPECQALKDLGWLE